MVQLQILTAIQHLDKWRLNDLIWVVCLCKGERSVLAGASQRGVVLCVVAVAVYVVLQPAAFQLPYGAVFCKHPKPCPINWLIKISISRRNSYKPLFQDDYFTKYNGAKLFGQQKRVWLMDKLLAATSGVSFVYISFLIKLKRIVLTRSRWVWSTTEHNEVPLTLVIWLYDCSWNLCMYLSCLQLMRIVLLKVFLLNNGLGCFVSVHTGCSGSCT